MSRVCDCGLSPVKRRNRRSRSVPFSRGGLVFHLFWHKGFSPRRAIDFTRVISVLPFIGRKWNNNRGGTENHGVTLGVAVQGEEEKKKNTTKNKFSLLTSWFRPRYAKMRHLNQTHTFKNVVSVCSDSSLLRDLCPSKLWPTLQTQWVLIWGSPVEIAVSSVPVSATSRKQMQCQTLQVSTSFQRKRMLLTWK